MRINTKNFHAILSGAAGGNEYETEETEDYQNWLADVYWIRRFSWMPLKPESIQEVKRNFRHDLNLLKRLSKHQSREEKGKRKWKELENDYSVLVKIIPQIDMTA